MKVAGIIAEYNPFHKGHAHMINMVKSAGFDACVAVVSGCFVQRGDAGICSKWARAEMALLGGVDLVIEMPVCYSMSGAQTFAGAGVSLIDGIGVVDSLCFGSESGRLAPLLRTADALSSVEFEAFLAEELSGGATFAAARTAAAARIEPETAELLRRPNDTLAIEYILAMRRFAVGLTPFTIKREGAMHDSEAAEGQFMSASQIRKMITLGSDISAFVPKSTADILQREAQKGLAPASIAAHERVVLAALRQKSRSGFAALPDISEGLENRLYAASRRAVTIENFLDLCKTKRYTMARLRRLMLAAFLGQDKSAPPVPPYIRVLGFNSIGAELLKKAKKTATLPIIVKPAAIKALDKAAQMVFEWESAAQDLWGLFVPDAPECGADYTTSPITVRYYNILMEELTCQ